MLGQEESGPAHQGARNSPETIFHLTGVRAKRGEADRAQSSSGPWPDPSHGVNSPKFSSIPFFPELGQGATFFPGAGQAASRNEVQAGLFIPLPSPFGLPSELVGGQALLTWPQRCPPCVFPCQSVHTGSSGPHHTHLTINSHCPPGEPGLLERKTVILVPSLQPEASPPGGSPRCPGKHKVTAVP